MFLKYSRKSYIPNSVQTKAKSSVFSSISGSKRFIFLFVLTSFGVHGQALQQRFLELERSSGGELGVYALHVEKGLVASRNESRFFPMASVYKLPIGIFMLNQVFEKRIDLSAETTVTREKLAPEYSPLARRWHREGDFEITWGELLRQMVSESDNTACDMILEKVGGPARVTRYFAQMGLNGFSINRTEKQMALDQVHTVKEFRQYDGIAVDSVFELMERSQLDRVVRNALATRKDVASPWGLAELLLRLHRRTLPAFVDYSLIQQVLTETRTGASRIKAGLPASASVAHKTGTQRTFSGVNIATNDVGIISLESGEHIILVVMLRGSTLDSDGREQVIADVTRAVLQEWTPSE